MTNAKEEFLKAIDNRRVRCALVERWIVGEEIQYLTYKLKVGYSEKEYEEFLEALDYEYDIHSDVDDLMGTVWFVGEQGWLRRHDAIYQCWIYYNTPVIPSELL